MDRIDLGGEWRIRYDPLSQGLTDAWRASPDSPEWKPIGVPGAWQKVLGVDANGVAWYRRELPSQVAAWARRGSRVLVGFASVATDCWAWVGEHEIGRHVGDYLPFEFDATDAVLAGETRLAVRVDQVHAPRPPKGVVVENGHITKGFHDVLSIQHAGIWGEVWVREAGACSVPPGGLWAHADAEKRLVRIRARVAGEMAACSADATLFAPDGTHAGSTPLRLSGDELVGEVPLTGMPELWSIRSPSLYTLRLELRSASAGADVYQRRVGFRTFSTGGPDGRRLLLNGRAIQVRGVLSWGHEPEHMAPAPTSEQTRREFQRFREMGFNAVCMCMFYPPEHVYDIADETGMLVWQEHPVWKSRMSPDFLPEYRRLSEGFFARDAAHPSVFIVSGTCEHEAYNEELSAWWWEKARERLPSTLRQIQTGFLEWTPPGRTDLYDDHVYDNPGRWGPFLDDIAAKIGGMQPKPFIMGETIISNAWPDLGRYEHEAPDKSAWWRSRGLEECRRVEKEIERDLGAATLARFREQGARWGPELRKRYTEMLRVRGGNAGFVTNSVRDVPICRVGLMDDLGHWRFTPEQTLPWLSDVVLTLRTDDDLRAIPPGESPAVLLGLSNFGEDAFEGDVMLSKDGDAYSHVTLRAPAGTIAEERLALDVGGMPKGPAIVRLEARVQGVPRNAWDLVRLPDEGMIDGLAKTIGREPTPEERTPEFEERGYSSGWGLRCASWEPWLPETGVIAEGRTFDGGAAVPSGTGVVLAHRMTREIAGFVERGGRCVLMASRLRGGMAPKWINLWGLLPLIVEGSEESSPVQAGESRGLLSLLMVDLTRRTTRAVHTQDLGIDDRVRPLVRYVYTHDSGVPNMRDAAFALRHGGGLCVVSTLDHSTPAGAWFLRRLLKYARDTQDLPPGKVDLAPLAGV